MPDLYKVTIEGTLRTTIELVHKTFWLPAVDTVDIQAFGNTLGGRWLAFMQERWPEEVSYTHLTFYRGTGPGPGVIIVPSGWPFTCEGVGGLSANSDTVLLRLRRVGFDYPTLNIMHLPPPLTAWYRNGQLASDVVADLNAAGTFLLGPLFEGGGTRWDAQIYSERYARSYQPSRVDVNPEPGDLESRKS